MKTLKVRCGIEESTVVLENIRSTRENIKNIVLSICIDHIILCFPGFFFILMMLCLISNLLDMNTYRMFEKIMPFLMIISLYVIPVYLSIKLKGDSIGRKQFGIKVIYQNEDNKNYILRELCMHALPYTLMIIAGYKMFIFYIVLQSFIIIFDKKHRNLQDIILKSKIVVENEEYSLELK